MTTPSAYEPERFDQPIDLDLSRNEGNPGSADLVAALGDPTELLRRYPDTSRLRSRLAELHGVSDRRVLVTAGGDDALLRCFMARTGPGREVLATQPTFEMIQRYAEQVASRVIEVPWLTGSFPTGAVLDAITASTDILFLVSPNNPTGAVADGADLRNLAGEIPFVVLDAAYGEFAEADLTGAALEMDNVVVVRTLSKAYGLAGLRVGYLLGPTSVIDELSSYGSPYPVSGLSAAAALARLDRPPVELERFVGQVKRERTELSRVLRTLGCEALPSQANFVLAGCPDAEQLVSGAAALGVGLRRFPGRSALENAVRITLPGDEQEFKRLVQTLEQVLKATTDMKGSLS
ncbi:MAG: histidinol-phosphate transaminase [Acidimicrobiales bacterium]